MVAAHPTIKGLARGGLEADQAVNGETTCRR